MKDIKWVLYGEDQDVNANVLDPVLRRLWYQKQTPEQVAKDLGHSVEWVRSIHEKRIKGESGRRGFRSMVINRPIKFQDTEPDIILPREDYFI